MLGGPLIFSDAVLLSTTCNNRIRCYGLPPPVYGERFEIERQIVMGEFPHNQIHARPSWNGNLRVIIS